MYKCEKCGEYFEELAHIGENENEVSITPCCDSEDYTDAERCDGCGEGCDGTVGGYCKECGMDLVGRFRAMIDKYGFTQAQMELLDGLDSLPALLETEFFDQEITVLKDIFEGDNLGANVTGRW